MSPKPTQTNPILSAPHQSSFGVHDILFVLFKHKGKIGALTALGLIFAALVYFLFPATYESQAKLLVRYVLERSAVDAIDNSTGTAGARANVFTPPIASEIEILTSWDLAVQVAAAIGPKRLLPKEKDPVSEDAAALVVSSGLEVTSAKGGNILFVNYTNSDPQLTTLVLSELVKRYFIKHLEVHRSAGAFDFVTQQTDQVRARLNQTEDALKPLKAQAGIISLKDSQANIATELARIEGDLRGAQTELAEQQARVKQLEGSPAGAGSTAEAAKPDSAVTSDPASSAAPEPSAIPTPNATPSSVETEQYQILVDRLTQLRKAAVDMSAKYTPENPLLKLNAEQIAEADGQKRALESKFPEIASKSSDASTRGRTDLVSERAKLAGCTGKVEALKVRLQEVQGKVKQLSDLGPPIAELERRRDLEEANYKYFEGALEKARIDEALDPTKIPNISAVQIPSPPMLVTKTRNKVALGLAGGGLALGIAFSLLSDLLLNRTVKRPLELERQLNVPLLLSIPDATSNRLPRLPAGSNHVGGGSKPGGNGRAPVAPWSPSHFIRPYCEVIRDRFSLYFELHQLTHKPKLIGVAAFSPDAGASTLAAGLAAVLSETDDSKVLLVDANLGPTDVHPFFKGKPAYPLVNALNAAASMDPAAENLYLATVGSAQNGIARLGVKKFFDLMPNLKASDYDYIIFDMPPLSQTSPTWGMSSFMDKMLLVVEAEKNDRDLVKRGYAKLQAERNNISVVFNKARSFGPKWLSSES
jgi:polysaccharide biosynthesis transport protein